MDESFVSLTKNLAQELQNAKSPDQMDEMSRLRLSAMLDEAQRKIEPPMKFMQKLTQGANGITAARIAIAMGIFDAFAANKGSAMTIEELDSNTKGDSSLLTRIVRLLSTNGLAESVPPNKWRLTAVGSSLVTGSIPAMMIIHFYDHVRERGTLLEYFEQNNFQTPNDLFKSPWQHAYNTKQSYFEWIGSGDRLRQDSFNAVMKINQQFRGQDWFEFYPVEEKLKTQTDQTLLIDIGGGLGHDAFAFRKKFPDLPGQVVLQDLPQVISKIEESLPAGLETKAYDAFTPQPIQGAKAYYLRTVLHDFPDKQALQILGNVRNAMNESSVLLINENLMPEENISAIAVDVDFIMMNCMASLERTEKQWLQLIDDAGFKLVQIWRPTQQQVSPNAVFEAVLR